MAGKNPSNDLIHSTHFTDMAADRVKKGKNKTKHTENKGLGSLLSVTIAQLLLISHRESVDPRANSDQPTPPKEMMAELSQEPRPPRALSSSFCLLRVQNHLQ